jgi:hypothetical protein
MTGRSATMSESRPRMQAIRAVNSAAKARPDCWSRVTVTAEVKKRLSCNPNRTHPLVERHYRQLRSVQSFNRRLATAPRNRAPHRDRVIDCGGVLFGSPLLIRMDTRGAGEGKLAHDSAHDAGIILLGTVHDTRHCLNPRRRPQTANDALPPHF